MDILAIAGLALPAAAIYTAPAMIAYGRRLAATRTIIVIDLFLGWTLIGWAVALAKASRRSPGYGYAQGTRGGIPLAPRGHAAVAVTHGQQVGGPAHPQLGRLTCGCPEGHVVSVWHSLN
jgi:Superinfection immunity protein